MRPGRLLLSLAAAALLAGGAQPALASDVTVGVVDFAFLPEHATISVGDSVTWRFDVAGHTSTSRPGQGESWNSAPTGNNPAGTTFTHTFTKAGRYEYFCIPHEAFMAGSVTVRPRTDTVARSIASMAVRRTGRRARVGFRLREPAAVTLRLRGPSRRTLKRARLDPGRHGLTLRRLRRGSYVAVLTATDDFGKRTRARRSFTIG
jgi:plastocyanin